MGKPQAVSGLGESYVSNCKRNLVKLYKEVSESVAFESTAGSAGVLCWSDSLLETLTCHRLPDDEAKIKIIDLVHIPLHTCHGMS
jgi:hypothetical protein